MSHQYFEDNSDLDHQLETFQTWVLDQPYRFQTDSGVFSRNRLDFGSRLLIETAAQLDLGEGPCLDLGCGYGPIGIITADQHPALDVHMVDISERALELARHNAQANGVDNVQIYRSDAYDQVSETGFTAILTNPPIRAGKKLVHHFIEVALDYLAPGGQLLAVIQKKQGAPSAMKKFEAVFPKSARIARKKGYWILQGIKGE